MDDEELPRWMWGVLLGMQLAEVAVVLLFARSALLGR